MPEAVYWLQYTTLYDFFYGQLIQSTVNNNGYLYYRLWHVAVTVSVCRPVINLAAYNALLIQTSLTSNL